jgi:hypothetical protein
MAKVTIERMGGDSYEPVHITVKVDGVEVGNGGIGGEPEDNCEARDYRWVRPMIEKLAKALGAEVETVAVNDDEDEDEDEDV